MIIGYKATNSEIRCNGYQFVPGEWHVHEGPIKKCESGFHFCRDKNGVFNYYSWPCRIWKVEAEEVESLPLETGTLAKFVCRRIRLVEEITTEFENKGNNSGYGNSGYGNSGDLNSGNLNSGYRNSGYGNSGYGNSGDGNSGDLNSGNLNSGYRNSGYGNSGDKNSGNQNSGNRNSGNQNSGNRNSGYGNSGNENSGYYNIGNNNSGMLNITDGCSGSLCIKPQKIYCFDEPTNYSHKDFYKKYNSILLNLFCDIKSFDEIDENKYSSLPNFTKEKFENFCKLYREKLNENSSNI